MKPAPFGTSLEAASRELSRVLPRFGFASEFVRRSDAAFRRHWIRDQSWRQDVVEIVYRRGGELSLILNLQVQFPDIVDSDGDPMWFDGRGLTTPRVPRLFAALRAPGYARRVVRQVVDRLDWFEQFATPVQCLARVKAEDFNGPRAGRRLQQMVSYLEHL